MSKRWRLAVLAGLFALVSACGTEGTGNDGVASVSTPNSSESNGGGGKAVDDKADEDKVREYAKCMREHGIDMPDPKTDGDGGVMMEAPAGGAADRDKMAKADEACRKHLPNGGAPPKMSAEDIDNMRKTAKCLRDLGYDVADPTAEAPYLGFDEPPADDEKFQKDMEKCGGGEGQIAVRVGEGK